MATLLSSPWVGRPVDHRPYLRWPPSPPAEPASRCSLPSISNLLGLADAGSPINDEQLPPPRQPSPLSRHASFKSRSRPATAYSRSQSYQPREFPPSPPMSIAASVDNNSSPCAKTSNHFSSLPSPSEHYFETTPPVEAKTQRQHVSSRGPAFRTPLTNSRSMSQSTTSSSYFPPASSQPSQVPGINHQRPLPQSFPPANVPMNGAPSSGAIAWQHHHYLHPSPGHTYTQIQDRYLCPSCNKAFSRPSSLRIHSHSHTGEKPFKCSQSGCGKAFSVRSNMKRHERGCHGVELSTGLN